MQRKLLKLAKKRKETTVESGYKPSDQKTLIRYMEL